MGATRILAVAILVVAWKGDPESLFPSFDGFSFRRLSVGGEKVWRAVPVDSGIAKELKAVNADPHIASLDGQLLVASTSRAILERQMRLYRKSEGKEGVFGEFSASTGGLGRAYVFGVGDVIRRTALLDKARGKALGGYLKIPSACEELITGLKTLVVDVNASKGGAPELAMSVEAASEGDAKLLRSVFGASLALAKRFGTKSSDMSKEVSDAIKGTSIGGQGSKIEVRCSDATSVMKALSSGISGGPNG